MTKLRPSHRLPRPTALLLICFMTCVGSAQETADSALADAVEKKHIDLSVRLLASNIDINATQADGMTALHWAAYHDQTDLTRKLIAAGAEIGSVTKFGITPLTLACQNASEATVQLLLENGADPHTTRDGEESVLATAARAGDAGTVRALIAAGASIDRTDENGQTPLMWAAAAGNTEVVKALVQNKADQTVTLKSGFTALTFAIRNGHTDTTQLLLADNTDINQTLQNGRTGKSKSATGMSLLMLAIENAHYELAAMLLEAGADPNDDRSGFAPLHALSWVRKPEIGDNARGNPPPHGSGKVTSLEFAKILVLYGADVNFPKRTNSGRRLRISVKGATPFLCAASTADVAYMKTLRGLGADPSAITSNKQTALMMAAGIDEGPNADGPATAEQHFAAVQYLLGLDLDNLNQLDAKNQSVMHAAAYKSLPKVIKLLDANGAHISIWNCKNNQGRTPLDIARGDRPGNFKPDFQTVRAIEEVMQKHGVNVPETGSRGATQKENWKSP